jgi:prepilin-type N-terminal cleavage/methylation domain-containing protein
MRNRSDRGFSFIEMLVAMILVGIIASLAIPRLRGSLEKQNIRSAKALTATLVATARSVAVQRGCAATLNMTTDSIWVTACGVNPVAAVVQVGTKKLVGEEFAVTLNPSAASIVYDPRGIQTQFQTTTIRFIGPNYRDSVMINQVGKVVRQ